MTKKRNLKDRHLAKKAVVFVHRKKEFFSWAAQFRNPDLLRQTPMEALYCDSDVSCWLLEQALLDAQIDAVKVHLLAHELVEFGGKPAAKGIELTVELFDRLFELDVRDTVLELKIRHLW